MTTRVVNIRSLPADPRDWPPDHVYIGRPRPGLPRSRWGNPFRIDGAVTRDEVVAAYERWLRHRPQLLQHLGELRGKVLVCYCAPSSCHGDVLARLADAT